jgi:hypothetical protein
VKDQAKGAEERQKELVSNLAAAKTKEEELLKKTVETRSLRSELASALSANKELTRDKVYIHTCISIDMCMYICVNMYLCISFHMYRNI